jgi:multiple sugar transport system ATP-binding protein
MVFEEGKLENARKVGGGASDGGAPGAPRSDEPIVWLGEVTLPGNGFKIPVPGHLRERLGEYVGRHVVLGIRPEHFHMSPVGGEGDCCPVDVKLQVIEPLGNDMDVYASTNLNDHVVARLEATVGMKTDTRVQLYADLRKVHFFEPGETGMNISRTSERAHALA